MPTIDPTTLTPARLAPMLSAWCAGLHPSEAAVGLLVAHDFWLRRRDFLAAAVDAVDDGWGPRGVVVPMAAITWDRVVEFLAQAPASSSELAILKIAASLAGVSVPGTLLDWTTSLDESNGRHVLDAVGHRFGWHEHGTLHVVTGHQRGAATARPRHAESGPGASHG